MITEVTTGMITNIILITFAVGLLAVQVTRTIMMIYTLATDKTEMKIKRSGTTALAATTRPGA
jgi:hypothetical protein